MSKTAIAQERIEQLFENALTEFSAHPERSHRYVAIALKIAQKARIAVKLPQSRQYCKKCHNYQFPGINQRKRTQNGKIILTCLDCKTIRRIRLPTRR